MFVLSITWHRHVNKEKKMEQYENVKLEIIVFDSEDIVTASPGGDTDGGDVEI